ncbi:MAG TPA: 4-(cytidine 5'-diphospho)-2-C-methyl-D-erythritol kinase, partial [Dehalococcoidia bacterium]|nr:4-(cytidine 5'-diphospho)-2-C-methyl-D-erythritol kinase [Dehalococcoidia bacterium]
MSRTVRVIAPAKLNWSLEVLRIRPDGYHEVRSVLQTLALHDAITLSVADAGVELEVAGPAAGMLADAPPESNLAYRAAEALRRRAGAAAGVRIRVE